MKLADHLDKLKAFKVIAESRTMGEAAKRLHITQPSLTKLVQTLEAATDVQLLIRGRNGVALTEAGQKLLKFSTQTLNGLADLEQGLLYPADDLAGHLKIGAYSSLGEYLWPEFLPIFRKQYPQMRLSICSAEGSAPDKALQKGEIDVLIDAEPRVSGDMLSWNLYEDKFNFYAEKHFYKENIEDSTLIYSPYAFDGRNKKIIHHIEEKGYLFRERIEFDSFMPVLAFARKGAGIAILPDRLAESDVKSKRLKQVNLKGFPPSGFGQHHFAATILDSKKDDPKVKALIQALRVWLKR